MDMNGLSAAISRMTFPEDPVGEQTLAVEETLVLETQRGDYTAFSGIYEQFFDRIFRYVKVRIGNAAEAERFGRGCLFEGVREAWYVQGQGRPLRRVALPYCPQHGRRPPSPPKPKAYDDSP